MLNAPIATYEIQRAIKEAKIGNTPGPDGLTAIYYKKLEDVVTDPLKNVMNNIFKEGNMPESWKESLITLIPKPGVDHQLINNYRPISLLNRD